MENCTRTTVRCPECGQPALVYEAPDGEPINCCVDCTRWTLAPEHRDARGPDPSWDEDIHIIPDDD
jgi:hypothetical protein